MKKRILLFTIIAGMCYVIFSSYITGPATFGYNRTGSQGSITNCGTLGSGCHNVAAGTTVTITVDSGTVATTRYFPGKVYTIKIHGTSTSSNNFFGFEFSSVSGSTTQVQAGSVSGTGLPHNVFVDAVGSGSSALNIVEHHDTLEATSPGVYDVSFTWTAPSTNVGNITLYTTLNAVNGDDVADAADVSGNVSYTLTPITSTSVSEALNNTSIKAFPNPVMNNLSLQFDNAQSGMYSIRVYDIAGRSVYNESAEINNSSLVSINTNNWVSGLYEVVVEKDGSSRVLSIVK